MSQEKVWPCEEIKDTPRGWVFRKDYGKGYWAADVSDDWICCPVCSAKRPEKPEKPKKFADIIYEVWVEKHKSSSWKKCLSEEHDDTQAGFNAEAKAAIEAVLEIMDSISCLDEDSSHKLSKDYKSELKQKLNELLEG